MIWLLPVAIIGLLIAWVGVCLLRNDDLLSLPGIFTTLGGSIIVLACALIAVLVFSNRSVGRTTCRNWGEQTGIRTKFVVLNWSDGGTCLAHTPDGRWVLNSNWMAFVKGNR